MPHFASALEGRLPAGAAGIRLKSIQGLLSLLLLVFVLSAHALPAPARRSILRPMGAIDARHAGMQRQCRLTCLRGGQDAQGEETEGEVNRESKDGSAEEEDGSSPGSAGADASKEDGEQEAENEQEGAGQTPAPFVHRAAFGIPVPNELAASVVNLLISVGCILLTAVLRAGYLYRGQQPPNPGAMQVTMNVLMGMSSVQLLFIVHRLLVQAAPTIKNVYRDVFQPGEPPKTKEEAMAKRRRQRVALRVMRTISTIMFMALYRARGRMSKSDGGGGGGGGAQAAATVASLASTFSSLKSSARWMWMSALESIFTLLGDELALLGLYVAEGRELTDEQKARVAQLVKEQEEREAAENGENLGDGKEEEEGGEEEKEGSGEQREGMELRKPGLEGLLSGIGSFFARRKEEAAAVASPPLREEEEEVREKVRSDSCPVDSRGEEVAAPGLRGSEERAEVQAEEEEEEVNAGPDLSLRKGEEEEEEQGEEKEVTPGPQSITDMIPSKFRPLLLSGVLLGSIYMLFSQLLGMLTDKVLNMADLEEEVELIANPQKREAQLSAMVTAAFDDAGFCRDNYVNCVSIALSALGSVQGFLRVFQSDSSKSPPSLWLSSPLVRFFSTVNGHMVWYILSMALGFLGNYHKKGVYYFAPLTTVSSWHGSGITGGLVSAHMEGQGKLSVTASMRFGGEVIKRTEVFNVTLYTDGETGVFHQRQFVADLQTSLLSEWPELKEKVMKMKKLPAVMQGERKMYVVAGNAVEGKQEEQGEEEEAAGEEKNREEGEGKD